MTGTSSRSGRSSSWCPDLAARLSWSQVRSVGIRAFIVLLEGRDEKDPLFARTRSGDPVVLAACLARKDAFDRSIADFSERYANQNEKDHEQPVAAVKPGRLRPVQGV